MASALDREEDSADEAEDSEGIVAPVDVPVVVDVDDEEEEDAEEELEEVHEVVDEEDQIDNNSNDVILPPHVLASLPVLWMTRYALDDMLVTLFQVQWTRPCQICFPLSFTLLNVDWVFIAGQVRGQHSVDWASFLLFSVPRLSRGVDDIGSHTSFTDSACRCRLRSVTRPFGKGYRSQQWCVSTVAQLSTCTTCARDGDTARSDP